MPELMQRGSARAPNTRLRTLREQARRESRHEFARAVRQAAADMGEAVGCDSRLVARWENGEIASPRPVYLRVLAALLGVPVDQLGFRPAGSDQTARQVIQTLLPDDRTESDEREIVNRRQFLMGVAAAAATVGEPWERLSYVLSAPRTVNPDTVRDLEARTAAFFEREEVVPARRLFTELSGHLDKVTGLIAGGATSGGTRRRLVAAAGSSSALAGWLAFDLGDYGQASRYLRSARQAADEAEDPLLRSCVLAYASYLASAQSDPQTAYRLLDAAQDQLRGHDHAWVLSWLAAREAEEAATLGDQATALRALERATSAYGRVHGDGPVWVRFFTPTRLGSLRVSTFSRLGDNRLTAAAVEVASGLEGGTTKVHAITVAEAATALIKVGQLEQGCDLGTRAVEQTAATETSLARLRLGELRQALSPYRQHRPARDLDERIRMLAS